MREPAATTAAAGAVDRPRVGLLDRPRLLLGIAAGLHVGLFLLLLLTQLYPHDRWYFPSDDQNRYYGFAKGIVDGSLVPQPATIGYDVFLVPYAAVTDFVLQAIPLVALTQLVLGLAATALVYRAGIRLLDRRAALIAAAVWLALPLLALVYIPTADGPAPVWLGLQISVDYPSALLAAALLALAAGAQADGSVWRGAALGAVGGLAVLVKPPNAIALGTAVLALLLWRRFASAAVACAVAAVVFVPQLVYNTRLFGNPTSFAYTPSVARRYLPQFQNLVDSSFSPANLPRAYGRLIVHNATGPVVLIALALALWLTWRRYPAARWLVVAPVVGYGLFYGVYRYGVGDAVLRYITPALPAIALATGAALSRGRPRPDRPRAPRVGGTVALAAAVAGSVALSTWIAVASPGPAIVEAGTTHARVGGRSVTLTWDPPRAPAKLSYLVVRSRLREGTDTIRGFRWLEVPEGRTFGVRDATAYVDRPGAGTWWYRVLIAPGPNSQGWPTGVPVATLPPVRAVVG